MRIEDLVTRILEREERWALLRQTWGYQTIRMPLFHRFAQQQDCYRPDRPAGARPRLLRLAGGVIASFLAMRRYHYWRPDVVVVGGRMRDAGVHSSDPLFSPMVAALRRQGLRCHYISKGRSLMAGPCAGMPLDAVYIVARILALLPLRSRERHRDAQRIARALGDMDTMGMAQLHKAVVALLQRRTAITRAWGIVLRAMRPRAIVVVDSYTNLPLVDAAWRRGCIVLERQHGVACRYHLGYHFPEPAGVRFPDRFVTFGDGWRELCHFPLSQANLPVGGYPGCPDLRAAVHGPHERRLLVLSEGVIAPALAAFTIAIAERVPEVPVAFRLHPNEVSGWLGGRYLPALRAACEHLPNLTVDIGGQPLVNDLRSCRWVLGVSSTACFEALAAGCHLLLAIDLPSSEYLESMLDRGGITPVHTPQDAVAIIIGDHTSPGTTAIAARWVDLFVTEQNGWIDDLVRSIRTLEVANS